MRRRGIIKVEGWEAGRGEREGGRREEWPPVKVRRFLKKITSRCWIPVNAHALIKEGTVFNDYCVFVQTGKNNSKSFWDLSQAQPNF